MNHARPDSPEPALNYGWGRLFLCYSLTPLLAKALGGRGRRYVETFIWLDLALLVANVVIDRGPRQGLRRLPREMGLWPPRQRRHHPLSWGAFIAASAAIVGLLPRTAALVERASKHPAGRFLKWTPLEVGWSPPDRLSPGRLFYLIPLAVFAEETYIRGLLWSRMAWLGRWRPLVSGTAWAFYHLNQPLKNIVGSILPGALLSSYAREFTGNIYWTAIGHYLSNAYGAWQGGQVRRDKPSPLTPDP
ncbi:MAG: CPBP family intramembrane metalloprotease [Chloroflexi bacterium]|nr:CPBP family intramembrane metalloprotease [Chloroflexota bacterium]